LPHEFASLLFELPNYLKELELLHWVEAEVQEGHYGMSDSS